MDQETPDDTDEIRTPEGENVKKRWSTRRRIAYISLATGIMFMIMAFALALTSDEFAKRLGEIMTLLSTGVFTLFGLVGAYMGLSSMGARK